MNNMDKFRRERIDMIIAMVMFITHLPRRCVVTLLRSTKTYQYIVEGEESTLYDGYSANLFNMAEEVKKRPDMPRELELITDESIMYCNNWMRINKIQNAKQFMEKIMR